MNSIINVISGHEAQPTPSHDQQRDAYSIYCTGFKRATRPGQLIAAVELFIPCFELHLSCRLLRDDRGHQRLDLPRVKVEDPAGKIHHKSLLRWHTAQAEQRFQRLALAAVDEFRRNTSITRAPARLSLRFAPISGLVPNLTQRGGV
jgi:hypothetical protein